jgi:hypothetical protein
MRTQIFCFGSNLAGRHGKGAAKYALKHFGAVYSDWVRSCWLSISPDCTHVQNSTR